MITNCLHKLTNTELAKNLSVTSQCVSQWISGKRQPSIELLPKMAEVLNCSIEQVVLALIQAKNHATKKSGVANG